MNWGLVAFTKLAFRQRSSVVRNEVFLGIIPADGSRALETNSLAPILGRVADPVESFSFPFVQDNLLVPVLENIRDVSGQLDGGQPDEPECVHGDFTEAADRRLLRR
jgi:hypothetical protein